MITAVALAWGEESILCLRAYPYDRLRLKGEYFSNGTRGLSDPHGVDASYTL